MLHIDQLIGKLIGNRFYFINPKTDEILEGVCLGIGVTELGYIYFTFNTIADKQWFECIDKARVFETHEQASAWLKDMKPVQEKNEELRKELDKQISSNITHIIGEPPLKALIKEIREAQEA
jgi:hypothetical protein